MFICISVFLCFLQCCGASYIWQQQACVVVAWWWPKMYTDGQQLGSECAPPLPAAHHPVFTTSSFHNQQFSQPDSWFLILVPWFQEDCWLLIARILLIADCKKIADCWLQEDVAVAGLCHPLPPPHLLPLGHLRIPQTSAQVGKIITTTTTWINIIPKNP